MALRTLARYRIGRIYHRLRPYKHVENSVRGVRRAKRAGDRSIDIDLQITRDGVIVACHDNQPMLHGFFDPLHRLPRDAKISDLRWVQVARLLNRSGGLFYRIRRIETILAACHKYGRVALLEPKNNAEFSLRWPWDHIVDVAEDLGATVSVRALTELHGHAHVAAARAAGIQAWEI